MDEPSGMEIPLFSLGVTAGTFICEASPLFAAPDGKLIIPTEPPPPVPINDVMFIKFNDPPIPPKKCDPCAMKPAIKIIEGTNSFSIRGEVYLEKKLK